VKITFLLKNPVKGYFPLTPLNSYVLETIKSLGRIIISFCVGTVSLFFKLLFLIAIKLDNSIYTDDYE